MKIDFRLKFAKYLDFCENYLYKSESGYNNIVKEYTKIENLSKKYLCWFHPTQQIKLMNLLGLGDGTQNHDLRKRKPVILSD